jgi:hypothetical protein
VREAWDVVDLSVCVRQMLDEAVCVVDEKRRGSAHGSEPFLGVGRAPRSDLSIVHLTD